jgi:hypothetical protein
MHLLGPNFDNGSKSLSSVFKKLCVNIRFNHQFVPPYIISTCWELDLLPKYCIDHPKTNNLLLFGMPFMQHPWGINMTLCIVKVEDA